MSRTRCEPPLAYTDDPVLAESLLRLAAVADVEITILPCVSAVRGAWALAPLVLLGADALPDALLVEPPRRPGVVLVRLDDADIWESAVRIGADAVMTLPADDAALIARLVDRDRAPGSSSPLVVVTGGCGGAGSSHLAAAIAGVAAHRVSGGALLIDGDSLGGGIELLVETEGVSGLRWRDLAATQGRVSPDALREALPGVAGLTVLSHDREPTVVGTAAWEALLDAGSRGFGLTVVDAPRDRGDAAWDRAALSIVVVPADLRSVAAAAARIAAVAHHSRDIRLVVRHRRDSDLDVADITAALQLPVIGEFADAKPVSAERVAEAVVAAVGVGTEFGSGIGSGIGAGIGVGIGVGMGVRRRPRRSRATRWRTDRRIA